MLPSTGFNRVAVFSRVGGNRAALSEANLKVPALRFPIDLGMTPFIIKYLKKTVI